MRLLTRLTPPLGALVVGLFGVSFWPETREPPRVSAPALPISLERTPIPSNDHAWIPPQCYAKTGEGRNPCFTCHTRGKIPNFVDDSDLQTSYSFPEAARTNVWTNLFVDRSELVASSSDDDILAYVRRENTSALLETLARPPAGWDRDENGRFDGYVPDAGFRFDEEGFDRGADGALTGWRAFAYYPFPGAFWPTSSGSMGDVLIRLPKELRQRADGSFDSEVYRTNLAIAEALMNERDVAIPSVDERDYGVDLDKNGRLGPSELVRFDFAPRKGRKMSWVGRAKELASMPCSAGLLPPGTELLHTLRYLDVVDGKVTLAARMKEIRYAKKTRFIGYADLEARVNEEAREDRSFPDRLREISANSERGVANGLGWVYQGFIEDERGELRPQSAEELVSCVGCHGGIGATSDGIFSFARKLPAATEARGWFHWSQHGLEGIAEPRRRDGRWEYTTYLETARASDDFGANQETTRRFFRPNGSLDPSAAARLHGDIAFLLLPSPRRALDLGKAYWAIVAEQSYTQGRDAQLAPATEAYRVVPENESTQLKEPTPPLWMPLARR